jgi:hypothetical protein
MNGERVNLISGRVVTCLAVLALITVICGYFSVPQRDEGVGAHIFQLSIMLIAPMILLFLFTADWKKPLRSMRVLTVPGAALALAFVALYYLEHYR